jgi:hypothetical protein
MILAMPYYDPSGKYNDSFRRLLPTLKAAFNSICLSVVPPTAEHNAAFVDYLEHEGCSLHSNAPGTLHGAHSRKALHLALEHTQPQESIFFGFVDRFLFAPGTEWRDCFLRDLDTWKSEGFVLFERSQTAWDTHPANVRVHARLPN